MTNKKSEKFISKRYGVETEPLKELPFRESTFETIDSAMFEYIDEYMNISTETSKGFKKVPLIWAGSERSYSEKAEREIRDARGMIIYPIMVLERVSTQKDLAFKGTVWGDVTPVSDVKGGSITVSRVINQDKTSNFANADAKRRRGQINFPKDNKRIVYSQTSIPIPVYKKMIYTITVMTNYIQQMNQIVTPFVTKPGAVNYIVITKDSHRYEAFIEQEFTTENNNNSLGESERLFKTKITINVLGYLIGEGVNEDSPRTVIRENAVEVKLPRARMIVGDDALFIKKKFFRS